MSNLIFNIRFGTWFFQVTKAYKCSWEQSEHWVKVKEDVGKLPKKVAVYQAFGIHF